MSRSRLLPFLLSAFLLTMACNIRLPLPSVPTPGPEIVDEVSIPWPEEDTPVQLTLRFGGGTFALSPAADEEMLLSGTATYNLPDLKPHVEVIGNRVEVSQGEVSFSDGLRWKDVKNEWRFQLGTRPLDLHIQAGAYQAEYDLGGLALTSLTIQDGAADVHLSFSSPNRAEMSLLRYETGASDVRMDHLGNANFKTMIFKSGAGDYTLDFSGELQQDATVTIETGLSNLILLIPQEIPAQVTVEGGLTNVAADSGWSQRGNVYTQEGEGHSLVIVVQIGAGNLTLSH
ncbi:MAG: hypothetical protein D6770_02735 [Anaerolineae bacterium]|nr:MAG: hypothetical protein D6770_02735 [Anaerolineae bacterium]